MRPVAAALIDRTLLGDTGVDFRAMVQAVARAAAAVVGRQRSGGGAFLLAFGPEQEAAIALVLRLLEREIRRVGGGSVALVSPLTSAREEVEAPCVLFHHAPRVADAERAIGRWVTQGAVVIATGVDEEIERFEPLAPWTWLELELRLPCGTAAVEGAGGKIAELALWAACLDLWGCPGPVELLAQAAGFDETEAAGWVEACVPDGPLLWSEVSTPAALLVGVGGDAVAARLIEGARLGPEALWNRYERLIEAAAPDVTADRLTVLRLFRAWLAAPAARRRWLGERGRIRNLRGVVAGVAPRLARAARRPGEGLAWISMLRDYRLFDTALAVVSDAAARWPGDVRFVHARVEALARSADEEPSRFRDAVEVWGRLPAKIQRNPYFLVQWALLSARAGDRGRAADALDAVLKDQPTNLVARVVRADLALDMGEFDRAAAELEAALEIQPANVPALHVMARVRAAQGHWDEARHLLTALLARHPLNLHAHHYMGEIEAQVGEVDAARGHFEAVLRIDPENLAALHSLADLDYREARRALEGGDPQAAKAKLDEALGYLDLAMEVEPRNPRVRLLGFLCRAWRGAAVGRFPNEEAETAARDLDEWIEQNPRDVRLLHARGQVAEAAGRAGEAKAWYEAVLRVDRRNLHALASLADLALREGRTAEAQRWIAAHAFALETGGHRLPAGERDAWTEWLRERERRLAHAAQS